MTPKVVNIDGVGDVHLIRRKNSGRISVRVNAKGEARVNYPWQMRAEDAIKFVKENKDWVSEQKQKVESDKFYYAPGFRMELNEYKVEVKYWSEEKVNAFRRGKEYSICIPDGRDYRDEKIQEMIQYVVTEVRRIVAKQVFPGRVGYLAHKHGFVYNKVYVKNLKSKWGSCSSAKNINLNVHLVQVPQHLIDYVILHELVHTIYLNHGSEFKNKLNEVTEGKMVKLEAELKGYKIQRVV